MGINSVPLADGKFLLTGYTLESTGTNIALACYNADGTIDTSFGNGGVIPMDLGAEGTEWIRSSAVQSDGKIVVVGISFGPSADHHYSVLIRYLGNPGFAPVPVDHTPVTAPPQEVETPEVPLAPAPNDTNPADAPPEAVEATGVLDNRPVYALIPADNRAWLYGNGSPGHGGGFDVLHDRTNWDTLWGGGRNDLLLRRE